ncbi:MAG: hypothetical protein HQL63_01875 [Magnetococcales bacterium]|nr:hypothetical protein [Magnetococcales bacterium]MBF0321663.1 hypothetical protein [Magnetococcales bacterium]
MKKLAAMLATCATLASFPIGHAADATPPQKIKICGGPEGLSYQKFAQDLAKRIPASDAEFEVVSTSGGVDNVVRVGRKECQYGIAPLPMVMDQANLPVVANLFDSYTLMVCSASVVGKASSLKDLKPEGAMIAVGDGMSTANWTWKHLVAENAKLAALKTSPIPFTDAIKDVIDGHLGCAFAASGLDSPLTKDLDDAGKFIKIMDINVSVPKGFKSFSLDGKKYPKLLKGWFSSVDVLTFGTVLFHYPTVATNRKTARIHALVSQATINYVKELKK